MGNYKLTKQVAFIRARAPRVGPSTHPRCSGPFSKKLMNICRDIRGCENVIFYWFCGRGKMAGSINPTGSQIFSILCPLLAIYTPCIWTNCYRFHLILTTSGWKLSFSLDSVDVADFDVAMKQEVIITCRWFNLTWGMRIQSWRHDSYVSVATHYSPWNRKLP